MKYFVQNSTSTFSLFKSCGAQAASSPRQQQKQQQRFTLDQFLALARNGACTEYAPNRFHAIVMRLRTGSTSTTTTSTAAVTTTTTTNTITNTIITGTTTALIFQSGRVVLTGIGGGGGGGDGGGGVAVQQIHVLCRHEVHRLCRRVADALRRGGFPTLGRSLHVNGVQLRNLVSTRADCLRCALRIGGQQKGGTEEGSMGEAEFVVTGLFFISGTVIVTGVRDPLLMKRAVDTIQHLCAQYIRA